MKCFNCSKDLDFKAEEKIMRSDDCPHCGADMHVCKMCVYYDSSAYNECREPMAERIVEKEKANFCDFFKIGPGGDGAAGKDELMDAAAALFKK